MGFASASLANPITPLRLEADGTSSNFKAWSYGVDKLLLSREVGGLDLKDVLLNHGKGKQAPIHKEPSDPTDAVATQEYEDSVAKYRKREKADAAIISIFIGSTPPELVNTFHNYPTSNAIWKHLQDRFMNKTAVEVVIPCMFQVSSVLLSVEKESAAQAKTYALRASVPQASVASALVSAPFQRNRFPPCTYIVKYGNRKGQVCGGTNHPLATCFKKKDDEWYAIHGVDKKPPNWMRPRKPNVVEAQDLAQASASDSAPAEVRINLFFPDTAMMNEATSQYIGSSQAPQYIEFTLDSGATHIVLKETLSFKPYATPIPLLGADSSFTTLAKVAQKEIQEAGSRTIFSENEDYCDIIDPLTNKVLARFTLNSSGLYTLRIPTPQVSTTQAQAAITPCSCRSFSNPTILYHHRLGHPNFRTLADMAQRSFFSACQPHFLHHLTRPLPRAKSKLRQQPHPSSPSVAAAPLDLVHMDVWGPAPVAARGGHRYFLLVVADHTRYASVHLLHTKAEAPEAIIVNGSCVWPRPCLGGADFVVGCAGGTADLWQWGWSICTGATARAPTLGGRLGRSTCGGHRLGDADLGTPSWVVG
ncbi:unnamed protein product [Closterium sp. NIES-53]